MIAWDCGAPWPASVNPDSPGSMASTGFQAKVLDRCAMDLAGCNFRFAEQAIEVMPYHRLVLTALLKQKARQG